METGDTIGFEIQPHLPRNQMFYEDPDQFITWHRTDEPGDNPRWESKAGVIEQREWGDDPRFYGLIDPEKRTPIKDEWTNNLNSCKRRVEEAFRRDHPELEKYDPFPDEIPAVARK